MCTGRGILAATDRGIGAACRSQPIGPRAKADRCRATIPTTEALRHFAVAACEYSLWQKHVVRTFEYRRFSPAVQEQISGFVTPARSLLRRREIRAAGDHRRGPVAGAGNQEKVFDHKHIAGDLRAAFSRLFVTRADFYHPP